MGGGGQTQTGSSMPMVSPYLYPVLAQGIGQYAGAMGALPDLYHVIGNLPQLGVPGLNPIQEQAISGFSWMPTGGGAGSLNPIQQGALGSYGNIASELPGLYSAFTPNAATGQSPAMAPAFAAAQKAFETTALPTIQNQAVAAGQGNAGALTEAVANAEANMMAPLMSQQAQEQLAAAQQLPSLQLQTAGAQAGLGAQSYQQQVENLSNMLQAGGVPRDVAQQQAQAIFNRQMQQSQLEYGVQNISNLFPSLIGGSQTATLNAPKF